MSDSYFGFNTNLPSLGAAKFEGELLTADVEEEDEYDALNNETFGDAALECDWEEDHEKLSQLIVEQRRLSQEKPGTDFFDDSYDLTGGHHDIIEKSISHLQLEDDLEDSAIVSIQHQNSTGFSHPLKHKLFRSSPPPPAVLDSEVNGSPKTSSIWSPSHSFSMQEDREHSMMKPFSLSSDLYPNLVHSSPIPINSFPRTPYSMPRNTSAKISTPKYSVNSQESSGNPNWMSGKVMHVEDIERELLPARILRAEDVERDLLNDSMKSMSAPVPHGFGKSPVTSATSCDNWLQSKLNEIHSNQEKASKFDWMSISPPHNLSRGVRTVDELEKDMMKGRPQSEADYKTYTPESKYMQHINFPSSAPPLKFPAQSLKQVRSGLPPGYRPVPPHVRMIPPVRPQMFSPHLPPHPILNPRPLISPFPMSPGMFNNMPRSIPFPLHPHHPRFIPPGLKQQFGGFNAFNRFPIKRQDYDFRRSADDYSGLMTQKEKDWLIKIQVMQLQTDNPYVDDYYFTTYNTRKLAEEKARSSNSTDGPKLVLPERSKHESKAYVPVQFEGSLGKLQVVSVNFPRKVLDISVSRPLEDDEGRIVTNQSLLRYRRLLLDVEKLYSMLLEIDDEEKRMLALPSTAQGPHEEIRNQLIEKLYTGLIFSNSTEERLLHIMTVRKGRSLTMRSLNLFSWTQKINILKLMLQHFTSILRKDQNDQVFMQHSNTIMIIIDKISIEELVDLGEVLENNSHDTTRKEKSHCYAALKTKFGSTVLCAMLKRGEHLSSDDTINSESQLKWVNVVSHIIDTLCSLPNDVIAVSPSSFLEFVSYFQLISVDEQKFDILRKKLNLEQDSKRGGDSIVKESSS